MLYANALLKNATESVLLLLTKLKLLNVLIL